MIQVCSDMVLKSMMSAVCDCGPIYVSNVNQYLIRFLNQISHAI